MSLAGVRGKSDPQPICATKPMVWLRPKRTSAGGEVLQALMVAPMVIVLDEYVDLLPEIAGQVGVLQQNAVPDP